MPDTKITNAAMTPKTTQSVCKHCRKSVAFRGNYWLQVETSGYLSDELCAVNPNGRHEAEPASTGEPPEEFDMHITPRSVTRAARPSGPSAPQTSAEPCFRGCTATKDRKLCADNSGLMITWCGCECHDSPEPAAPQPVSGEKSHFVPGPRFCAWCSAWQGDGENHSKFCDRPAQGTPEPPKVDMPQLIAQEILDYAFRPVNGVWKLNFTTMKAIIQKYWLRCYFPPASQKEEIQTAKNELLERFASVFDSVSMPDMAAEIRSEIVATPASTARTDGLSLHKLCHLFNEESKNVMGTHYEQWASGLQRAITLIETAIEGGYVAAKEIASPAAPGSVPQAPNNHSDLFFGNLQYSLQTLFAKVGNPFKDLAEWGAVWEALESARKHFGVPQARYCKECWGEHLPAFCKDNPIRVSPEAEAFIKANLRAADNEGLKQSEAKGEKH